MKVTRSQAAVKKASAIRLRQDMAQASRQVQFAIDTFGYTSHACAYVAGLLEGNSSLSLHACILTVWGV